MDTEVFEIFFRENYCEIAYQEIKADFEDVLLAGIEDIFIPEVDWNKLDERNFIAYMDNYPFTAFEAIVEDAFDELNPEIVDAVMDISVSCDNPDEITAIYWSTREQLLKNFLGKLYEEKLLPEIKEKR